MGLGEAQKGLGPLSFAFVMFSMASCLPLFFLGPIAYSSGLSLEQALVAALLGNAIVAVAMALNGHAGIARRIDFPAQAREIFGTLGAKIVVVLRGLVGALWFGVEAYNGALALIMIALLALGASSSGLLEKATPLIPLALTLYLGLMLLVLKRGMKEGVGKAATIAGPLLLLYFAWLAWWLHTSGYTASATVEGVAWTSAAFLVYLAIQTNWWATVAVNMSDLTRMARDWRSVWVGVFLGMVGGQLLGTYLGYELAAITGKALPQEIIAAYAPGAVAILLGLLFAFLAPWTTDLTANVPALMDILMENLRMNWRKAAIAATILGFILAPWWALDKAQDIVGYVTSFAASYGVILGPILGPMIAGYWLLGIGRTVHHNPHTPRVDAPALGALALGIAASYAASIWMNALEKVALGAVTIPFPTGPTWYIGVAVSLIMYIIAKKIL